MRRTPSQYVAWLNPRKNPLKDNTQSEGWAKWLASFDCVVLLRDHPDYDPDFIRQHAKCVVDARQHGFDPVNGQTAKQLRKPIEVTYTGMVPILYRAQQSLLQNLIDTSWWAFAAIAVVMMFAVGRRTLPLPNVLGGLAAMIPAIFTVLVIFGEIGRRQLMVDIGTLMTAGVAMGVTVVGTFQFVTWFRRAVQTGLERRAAIKAAYRRGSVSILQTTVIAGLGAVALCPRHVRAHSAVRPHDGGSAADRPGGQPDPAARAAGRTLGPLPVAAHASGGHRGQQRTAVARNNDAIHVPIAERRSSRLDAQPVPRRTPGVHGPPRRVAFVGGGGGRREAGGDDATFLEQVAGSAICDRTFNIPHPTSNIEANLRTHNLEHRRRLSTPMLSVRC